MSNYSLFVMSDFFVTLVEKIFDYTSKLLFFQIRKPRTRTLRFKLSTLKTDTNYVYCIQE